MAGCSEGGGRVHASVRFTATGCSSAIIDFDLLALHSRSTGAGPNCTVAAGTADPAHMEDIVFRIVAVIEFERIAGSNVFRQVDVMGGAVVIKQQVPTFTESP